MNHWLIGISLLSDKKIRSLGFARGPLNLFDRWGRKGGREAALFSPPPSFIRLLVPEQPRGQFVRINRTTLMASKSNFAIVVSKIQ